MRVTSVELITDGSPEPCVLSFRDPSRAERYNAKNIDGLDADEILNKHVGSFPYNYHDAIPQPKDIVARIELNPRSGLGETYSDLRDNLFRMISSTRRGGIQVLFKDGVTPVATIYGNIRKVETVLFNKLPEIQVTIHCPDPLLTSISEVSVDVSGADPSLFILTDSISTAPHGFRAEFLVLSDIIQFWITDNSDNGNDGSGWNFTTKPILGFLQDDIIEFSSQTNNRYLRLVRDGITTHIAHTIESEATFAWPLIFPGDNSFTFNYSTDIEIVSINHYLSFWGV